MYGSIQQNPNDNFAKLMFDHNNLSIDNGVTYYKLAYVNHREIENIYALKLSDYDTDTDLSKSLIEKYIAPIINTNLFNKHNHPATYLHIYMSFVNLFNKVNTLDSKINENFPKKLSKYTIF